MNHHDEYNEANTSNNGHCGRCIVCKVCFKRDLSWQGMLYLVTSIYYFPCIHKIRRKMDNLRGYRKLDSPREMISWKNKTHNTSII